MIKDIALFNFNKHLLILVEPIFFLEVDFHISFLVGKFISEVWDGAGRKSHKKHLSSLS